MLSTDVKITDEVVKKAEESTEKKEDTHIKTEEKVVEEKPSEIPFDEFPSVQEESPFEKRSTAEEPYYMKENGYQALRGRETQRKLTEPGSRNYFQAGNSVLVRPSPLIRKESQPAPSSIKLERRPSCPVCTNRLGTVGNRQHKVSVRPFKNHFWWGDTVEIEIKEENFDMKQNSIDNISFELNSVEKNAVLNENHEDETEEMDMNEFKFMERETELASVHEDIEEEDQVKRRGSFKVEKFEAKSRVVAVFKDPKKVPPEPPPNRPKITEVFKSKYC